MLAHREAVPGTGEVQGTVLCVHGYPESAMAWRHLLSACAEEGWRAVAPDLAGFGASAPVPEEGGGRWERHVEELAAFHAGLDLGPVVLVVHDWGGLIGLRWACEHPEAVQALVISNTGFFPDGRWHGLAEALRTAGTGEELVANMTRDGFDGMLRAVLPSFGDEVLADFWRAFDGPRRRAAHLELYRSGDFAKLAAYEGRLAALDVPALVLWGGQDVFAPVSGGHRFARELPHARLEVLEDVGHFLFEEAPDRAAASVLGFLRQLEGVVAQGDDRRLG